MRRVVDAVEGKACRNIQSERRLVGRGVSPSEPITDGYHPNHPVRVNPIPSCRSSTSSQRSTLKSSKVHRRSGVLLFSLPEAEVALLLCLRSCRQEARALAFILPLAKSDWMTRPAREETTFQKSTIAILSTPTWRIWSATLQAFVEYISDGGSDVGHRCTNSVPTNTKQATVFVVKNSSNKPTDARVDIVERTMLYHIASSVRNG
jgi:hypothetical protein